MIFIILIFKMCHKLCGGVLEQYHDIECPNFPHRNDPLYKFLKDDFLKTLFNSKEDIYSDKRGISLIFDEKHLLIVANVPEKHLSDIRGDGWNRLKKYLGDRSLLVHNFVVNPDTTPNWIMTDYQCEQWLLTEFKGRIDFGSHYSY